MSQFILVCAMLLHSSFHPDNSPRTVLLFANPAEPLLEQQLQWLQKDSSGLAERDLQIKKVKPGDLLYKTFAVSLRNPFTLILVGRDGGEKYRSNQLTTTTQLFALIDAMPMRKTEVRNKKND